MKRKLIFLLLVTMITGTSFATTDPGLGKGKKDDINGTVLDADDKKPLKDVCVTAWLVSKKEKITLTDEDGNFLFDELKAGTYKFVFEKDGYKKVIKDKVVVKVDEAFQLKVEMLMEEEINLTPSPFHFY